MDIKTGGESPTTKAQAQRPRPNLQAERAKGKLQEIEQDHRAFVAKLSNAFLHTHAAYSKSEHILDFYTKNNATNICCYDSYLGTQAFSLIQDRTAILSFRGTTDVSDIAIDLVIVPWFWPLTHFGFAASWRSIRRPLKKWLADNADKFDKVNLYGHSLGGAIAHVAALELNPHYEVGEVITFGAPRSFPVLASRKYDNAALSGGSGDLLKTRTIRVVNKLDIVATIPYSWMLYSHVGQLVYINAANQIARTGSAEYAKWRDGFLRTAYRYLAPAEKEMQVYRDSEAEPHNRYTDFQGRDHAHLVTPHSPLLEKWRSVYHKTKAVREFLPFNLLAQLIAFAAAPLVAIGTLLYYLIAAGGAHPRESYGKAIMDTQLLSALPTEPVSTFTKVTFRLVLIVGVPVLVALTGYALFKASQWSISPLMSLFSS